MTERKFRLKDQCSFHYPEPLRKHSILEGENPGEGPWRRDIDGKYSCKDMAGTPDIWNF